MPRILRTLAAGILSLAFATASIESSPAASPNDAAGTAQSIDLFTGMQTGDLQVKFIAKSDREGQLQIQNKTKQPVSVQLPAAFVGVPVLAQQVGGFGGGGGNRGGGNNNNANQAVGGGIGGGGGFGGGGFGGGGFNIAPEAVAKLKMPLVCLEHGKKDPKQQIPYDIRPIESFTKDARIHELLTMFGSGQLNQRAAQAAAWHFANGMSWQELAAKKIDRLGRPDEQYFQPGELQLATRIVAEADRLAKMRPPKENRLETTSSEDDAESATPAKQTSQRRKSGRQTPVSQKAVVTASEKHAVK